MRTVAGADIQRDENAIFVDDLHHVDGFVEPTDFGSRWVGPELGTAEGCQDRPTPMLEIDRGSRVEKNLLLPSP